MMSDHEVTPAQAGTQSEPHLSWQRFLTAVQVEVSTLCLPVRVCLRDRFCAASRPSSCSWVFIKDLHLKGLEAACKCVGSGWTRRNLLPSHPKQEVNVSDFQKTFPGALCQFLASSATFHLLSGMGSSTGSLLLQGEREFVKDNKSLGNFRLDGIPSAPRGVPQVEVKFDIDANGILSVTATDKGTGKKQDIKITGASTLGGDEVDRMVGEAEKYAEEDKARREAVDTKNQVSAFPAASHQAHYRQLVGWWMQLPCICL